MQNCGMKVDKRSLFEMKTLTPQHVIGIPISSAAYLAKRSEKRLTLPNPSSHFHESSKFRRSKTDSVIGRINKFGEGVDSFYQDIREHVKIGHKICETMKGKLRLGAKILQVGGVEKVFKHLFSVSEGEKLLKASQCYLSTTAGPMVGLLFISTDRVAFCSDRSIKLSSATGELLKIHYKVSIPIKKIKRVDECENVKKPSRKYIQIVTKDNFEFWFMGFLKHQKTLGYLHQTICQLQ